MPEARVVLLTFQIFAHRIVSPRLAGSCGAGFSVKWQDMVDSLGQDIPDTSSRERSARSAPALFPHGWNRVGGGAGEPVKNFFQGSERSERPGM